jgi:hypothetical protein
MIFGPGGSAPGPKPFDAFDQRLAEMPGARKQPK